MIGLRDYQIAAHDAVMSEWGHTPWWDGERQTARSTVANLATSAGKTLIAAFIAKSVTEELGGRLLFVGDREELILQPVAKFHQACGIMAGVHRAAERASAHADVVVASIQTLARRLPQGRPFTHIIDDEAHRNTELRKKIHDAYPEAKVLGITATAFRKNMADLSKWYETVAFELGTFDLIGQGYITPIKVLTMPIEVNLNLVKQKSGDFDQDAVATVLEPYYRAVATAIKEHAPARQILAFLPLIRSSQEFVSILKQEGITAMHCDGGTPDRQQVIQSFEDREFQVLSNSQVFSTGVDFIRCDCMLNLAATRSRVEYRQRAGRIMRLLPGVIDPGGITLPTSEERKAAIAASEKPDCIAEGTLILTDCGLIPVENVTKSMRVWDGTCYRNHGGAICKGENETITYCGLTATEDHRVWTQQGWMHFSEAARNTIPIVASADGGRAIRDTEGYFFRVPARAAVESDPNADGVRELWAPRVALARCDLEGPGWLQEMWNNQARYPSSEVVDEPRVSTETSLPKSEGFTLPELRRKRDSIQLAGGLRSVCLGHRKSGAKSIIAIGPDRERWELRGGKSSMVNEPAEYIPYQQTLPSSLISHHQKGLPTRKILGFDPSKDGLRYDTSTNSGSLRTPLKQTKRRVWDILNCGPLHRFTANGLLVHNCLILDLLWQSEKIGLAGAAALVAGSEEEEEFIAEKIKKDRTPEELASARELFKQAKEDELRKAIERAAAQQVAANGRKALLRDPRELILELHQEELLDYVPVMNGEARKVDSWQKQKLDRYGYSADSLTCAGHAAKVLDAIELRQSQGLAPIEAFEALRAAGFAEPEKVRLNDAIRALGTSFPNTFGVKYRGTPLDKVPASFWKWLMHETDAAAENSRLACQKKHKATWRYVTKIVFPDYELAQTVK